MGGSLENYSIHICLETELLELQRFIKDHWKSNHALTTSKKLMDWQHYDEENQLYNFVIAKHLKTNEIHGILGFIPTCHFDKSIQNIDLWLAIWMIRDDIKHSGLGLLLLSFLASNKQPCSISAFGLNPRVIRIYKYMGYKVGILNHWYLVNKQITDFYLIGNFHGQYHSGLTMENEKKLIQYRKSDFLQLSGEFKNFIPNTQIPEKSLGYLYHRYYCHPIYNYHVYGIKSQGSIVGILVFRLSSHDSYHALRIVDYFGNAEGLFGMFGEFQRLLQHYNAEYIDFYNIGIKEINLTTSGFIKRDSTSEVIIPNYFEPFEKKNIDLDYAYKCDNDFNFCIFKGDSDQDRPNLIL
ncbi:MAG: hypothetical protein P9M13_06975 [Candidatus Ancaeobacter aquaticus]|nr:hypothetical protein [Candidatus Ancaeobacter aquaticus]